MLQSEKGGIDAMPHAPLLFSQAVGPLEVSTGTGPGMIDDLPGGMKAKPFAAAVSSPADQDQEGPLKTLTATEAADHLDPFGMMQASQQGSTGSSSPPMPSQTCQPPLSETGHEHKEEMEGMQGPPCPPSPESTDFPPFVVMMVESAEMAENGHLPFSTTSPEKALEMREKE